MKIEIDDEARTLTIEGIRYDFGIFQALAFAPIGTVLRLEGRSNGTVTISRVDGPEGERLGIWDRRLGVLTPDQVREILPEDDIGFGT